MVMAAPLCPISPRIQRDVIPLEGVQTGSGTESLINGLGADCSYARCDAGGWQKSLHIDNAQPLSRL